MLLLCWRVLYSYFYRELNLASSPGEDCGEGSPAIVDMTGTLSVGAPILPRAGKRSVRSGRDPVAGIRGVRVEGAGARSRP
jgi:hypothetical protein